jgi:hypothetical protein
MLVFGPTQKWDFGAVAGTGSVKARRRAGLFADVAIKSGCGEAQPPIPTFAGGGHLCHLAGCRLTEINTAARHGIIG